MQWPSARKGARFAIREGGRTVGAGTIAEIIEWAEPRAIPALGARRRNPGASAQGPTGFSRCRTSFDLACTATASAATINTTKNKKDDPERLEFSKFLHVLPEAHALIKEETVTGSGELRIAM